MTSDNRPQILCVDDEPRVVEGVALHLRKDYQVHTALSGEAGLAKLKELGGQVCVVVSDMRMPGMDGATFLKRVMRAYPDTSRILLTGEPGRDAAVAAVNEGQILRFLTKPCPPDQLRAAIDAAVIQYRLLKAEQRLMQETVIGCIAALTDVLAITNPVAFGRASRIKRISMEFAQAIGVGAGFWQLEAAAMLSQLGYLSLPVELVEKLYYGEKLSADEQTLAEGVPEVAGNLLGHIPRLEPVLQILNALRASDEQLRMLGDGTIGLGARILLLVLEYDSLVTQGYGSDVALQTVRGKGSRYGAELIEKFAGHIGAGAAVDDICEIPLRAVKPGMTILDDLRTHLGTLLVPRGLEVSETCLARLSNLGASILDERIKVRVPAAKALAGR
jgi:response regulator RpfG family c-di-GMP phosphodiesterase